MISPFSSAPSQPIDDPTILQLFHDIEPTDLEILTSRGIQSSQDIHLINNLEDFDIRSEGISLSGLARIRRIRKLLQAPSPFIPLYSSSMPKESIPTWIPQPNKISFTEKAQPPWLHPGVVVQYPSSTSTKKLGTILTTEGSHIVIQPINGGKKLYHFHADLSLPILRFNDMVIIISGPFLHRIGTLAALNVHQATIFSDKETVIVPPQHVVRFQRVKTVQPVSHLPPDSSTPPSSPPPLAASTFADPQSPAETSTQQPPIIYYPTSLRQQQSWLNPTDQLFFTKLHLICSRCESVKELQEILQAAAHLVNTQNIDGLFPLHYPLAPRLTTPVQTKHQFVKLLLDHGARIDVSNRLGHTPLDYASHDTEMLKLFSQSDRSVIASVATIRCKNSPSSRKKKSTSNKKRRTS